MSFSMQRHPQILAVALVLALVLTLGGCALQPVAVRHSQPSIEQAAALPARPHVLHVLSHGWHTGVAVRADDAFIYLPQLRGRFAGAQWLEFGWGDAGFYQSERITVGIVLSAMFVPTRAVMHVVGFEPDPQVYFAQSEHHAITVPTPAYHDVLAYLASSFYRLPQGELQIQRTGLYGDSQFYTGVGSYTLANTCNKWTAKALYSAGLDMPVALSLNAASIMSFFKPASVAQ